MKQFGSSYNHLAGTLPKFFYIYMHVFCNFNLKSVTFHVAALDFPTLDYKCVEHVNFAKQQCNRRKTGPRETARKKREGEIKEYSLT